MPLRKAKKISVLGDHNVKIPPITIPWNEFMSKNLQNAFLDIFEKEKRYNITEYIEVDYAKLFSKKDASKLEEAEEEIEITHKTVVNDNKEEKIEDNLDNKEENIESKNEISLNLKTCIISKTNKDDEHLITKDIIATEYTIFNGSNAYVFDYPIEKVYVCNKKMIYVLDQNKSFYFCYKDIKEEIYYFSIKSNTDLLTIPYSNEILAVNSENKLISIKIDNGEMKQTTFFSFYKVPEFTLSINSRYGENDSEKISKCFF